MHYFRKTRLTYVSEAYTVALPIREEPEFRKMARLELIINIAGRVPNNIAIDAWTEKGISVRSIPSPVRCEISYVGGAAQLRT